MDIPQIVIYKVVEKGMGYRRVSFGRNTMQYALVENAHHGDKTINVEL